jgi:hypothetical protein
MSATALVLVLTTVLLHAIWNAIVKSTAERTVTLGVVALVQAIPGAVLALNLPFPGWDTFAVLSEET